MASAVKRVRGSTWNNIHKKKGYKNSVGGYEKGRKGGRVFALKAKNGGKVFAYASPQEARLDGWVRA